MTRRRTASLVALALVVALAITGCGPVNAGSAAEDSFTANMRDQPGVAEVTGSSSNSLPFLGEATIRVLIEDEADDATFAAIVDRMAALQRDYPFSVGWRVTAQHRGFTFAVGKDRDTNADTLELLAGVRAVDGVTGGYLPGTNVYGPGSELVVADGVDVIAALSSLLELGLADLITVRTADLRYSISTVASEGLPDAEIAVLDAVATEYTIIGAEIEAGTVVLRIERDSDVAAATALLAALPGIDTLDATVYGGKVTRAPEGDFDAINPLIAQIAELPGVIWIGAEPRDLAIELTDIEDAVAIEAMVTAAGPPTAIGIEYRSTAGSSPAFIVTTFDADRAPAVAAIAVVLENTYVQQFDAFNTGMQIIMGEYDETRVLQLAELLKSALPEGTQVRLKNVEGGVDFTFRTKGTISVRDDDSWGDVGPEAFVATWNGIP